MVIYKPGTDVYLDPDHEVRGTIVRVFIESPDLARYRVSYWGNGNLETDNFREEQITPVRTAQTHTIGFESEEEDD